MKHTVVTIYLTLSGLLLLVIGGAILLAPHAFHASNDIALGNNPTLLSEIRAPGGLLTAVAIVGLISVVQYRLRAFAMPLLALVYGSFGLARLISIAQDGMPADSILAAAALELTIGIMGIAIVWQRKSALIPQAS